MSDNKTTPKPLPDWKPLLCRFLPALLLLAGCSVRLNPGKNHPQMPPGIFDPLLPLAQLMAPKHDTLTGFSPHIEGWVAAFTEHKIEQDDLLTLSNLQDTDSLRMVRYDGVKGFHQNLLLYHLRALPKSNDGKSVDFVAYLAIHYDDKDTVIHTGPLYFGEVNKLDGYINFIYELDLEKHGNQYSLVPKKSLSHLKTLKLGKYDMHLLFLADELKMQSGIQWWQRDGDSTIRVKKIVSYDANKIGGKMPLIFNIPEVLRDNKAIYFVPIK